MALVALVTLLALGAGLAVILIGLPILVLMLYVARGFADIQRFLLRYVLQRPVQRPRYRSGEGRRELHWLRTPIVDPTNWLNLWPVIFWLIPAGLMSSIGALLGFARLFYRLHLAWGWRPPP